MNRHRPSIKPTEHEKKKPTNRNRVGPPSPPPSTTFIGAFRHDSIRFVVEPIDSMEEQRNQFIVLSKPPSVLKMVGPFRCFFFNSIKIFWWVSVRWKRVLPGLPSFFFFKKYLAGARFFLRKKDFPIEFFFFFAKRFNENNFTYWSCLVFSTFDCTEFSSWERWDFEDDFTLAPNFWVRLPGFTSYFSTWSSLIVLLLSALFCVGILTITGFYLVFFFFGWRVGHPVQSWVRPWPTK